METDDSTCNGLENMEIEDEGFSLVEKPKNDGTQIADPSDLKFTEVPVSAEYLKKAKTIKDYLDATENPTIEKLRGFAISDGGLINDDLRKTAWPGLLGITRDSIEPAPSVAQLRSHPEFGQVVLDVNRSIKRFPPGIPYDQRVALQEQLTNLILRVITKYPHLRYYQGYHDVAITILLVVGEDMAFRIMEKLSTEHLRDCMEPTMEKTSYLLNYIFPLINHLSPEVYRHVDKSVLAQCSVYHGS
uniref:TBC1 domain family member 20 n=1 Tax=Lygus hesperus TaxID=30085 RepID=A0A0A9VSX9_LYGHE